MMGRETMGAPGVAGPSFFATTHWSVVLVAADENAPEAGAALERLCRNYWYPLYAYARRRGSTPEDAQDLTQEFFLRLLRKHYLSQVDPVKGKFRSFLLKAFNHFLANEWDRANTVKRGGRITFLALDQESAEQRLAEVSGEQSPEQIFERSWALALLEQVLAQLREESNRSGRADHFQALKVFLTGEKPSGSYSALASRLGTNEAALRKEVQRLRQRYGQLLRKEISDTVSSPTEVEDELCHLFTALGS